MPSATRSLGSRVGRDGRISNPVAGEGDRAEGVADGRGRPAPEGKQDIKAHDSRGANRQIQGTAARLAVQRLYELSGAGFDDHPARREVPLRAVADCEWRDDDSAAAGRHQRPAAMLRPCRGHRAALISSAGVVRCWAACENAWPVRSHARFGSVAPRSTDGPRCPSRSVHREARSRLALKIPPVR